MSKYHTVLAVDLDEVTFQYLNGLREHMETSKLDVNYDEPEFFSMEENGWFPTMDDFKRVHGEAVDGEIYNKLKVIEGGSETLHDLHESGYEINIVTSRFINYGQHKKVVTQTVNALDEANIPYDNLMFLSNKTRFLADTYIDDGPHNLEALVEADRHVIAFNWRYNEYMTEIDRAHNWTEVREILRNRYGH